MAGFFLGIVQLTSRLCGIFLCNSKQSEHFHRQVQRSRSGFIETCRTTAISTSSGYFFARVSPGYPQISDSSRYECRAEYREDMEGNFLSRGQLMSEEVARCIEMSSRSRQELTFCLLTALRLHGFEEPREMVLRRDRVHILSASRSERSRISSADYHFLNSRVFTEIVSYAGIDIRVTDPISTCIHMAQFCTREEITVLFDQLLRRHQKNKMSDYRELEERISSLPPQVNGSKRARWAWRHCRMNTDSSMETRLRLILEAARFPTPEVNPHFVGKTGQYDFYMDLAYCSLAIAFEYQGVEFHTGESWLTQDSMKAIAFMNSGGLIIPVTKEQLSDESMKKRLIDTVRSLRRQRMRLSGRQRAGYAALFEKT